MQCRKRISNVDDIGKVESSRIWVGDLVVVGVVVAAAVLKDGVGGCCLALNVGEEAVAAAPDLRNQLTRVM